MSIWSSPELIHVSDIVQARNTHFAAPPDGARGLATLYGPWGAHDVLLLDDGSHLVNCPSYADATSLSKALSGTYIVEQDRLDVAFSPKRAAELAQAV